MATTIGQATRVEQTITATGKASRTLEQGSQVEVNELIVTNGKGRGVFQFVDDTLMSIGPNSSIKLDSFVFAGSNAAKSFVIKAIKGTFRFVSGASDHESYVIHTPGASIGVRGTQFDVAIQNNRVTVSVAEGAVILCPNGGRPGFVDCVEATPGQTIRSDRTRADVVPTLSLPQPRAPSLLPLEPIQRRLEQDLPVPLRLPGNLLPGGLPGGGLPGGGLPGGGLPGGGLPGGLPGGALPGGTLPGGALPGGLPGGGLLRLGR